MLPSNSRVWPALLVATLVPLAASAADFPKTVQPFLAKNCLACHNAKARTGGLDLSRFHTEADVVKDRDLWERIERRIQHREMPPRGVTVPTPDEIAGVTKWIDSTFTKIDLKAGPDPGRVTARRLNRTEYSNTIRDLLAVNFKATDSFPPDDSGYGFDNIGDVLSLSPVLMEKYLTAAEKIAKRAIHADPPRKAVVNRVSAPSGKFDFPVEADYDLRATVTGRKPDMFRPMELVVQVDGQPFKTFPIGVTAGGKRNFEGRLHLPEGEHTLTSRINLLPFDEQAQAQLDKLKERIHQQSIDGTPAEKRAAALVDFSIDPTNDDPRKRGFHTDYFEVSGPYNEDKSPQPPSYAKIFVCATKDDVCAHEIAANLTRRAYRRPVTPEEVDKIAGFIKLAQQNGDTFDQGVRLALEAVLVSPDFLFRIERDRSPDNPKAQHRINDYELATRLSYFLWASMPDATLISKAGDGSLHKPEVLNAEVARMLKDPKAVALVDNFAGQWLQLRNLDSIKPDPDKFPEFDAELRASMKQETRLFFKNVVDEDHSILDFLNAKYSFVNERLAKFYGIDGVTGPEFRKVDLAGTHRGGVLTQASVLTVSSYPTRTSPVIRGKWVLENLLNMPPPPPPPDVPNLQTEGVGTSASLRQQMEKHRASAVCSSCHSKMDPLGFGLENFNAIGKYREVDGNFPIDSSGTMPDGRAFQSATELEGLMAADPSAFAGCVTEKMMTYALGRGLERYDRPTVRDIVSHLAANDYKFSKLILEIVNSMPFQMRRGDASNAHQTTLRQTSLRQTSLTVVPTKGKS